MASPYKIVLTTEAQRMLQSIDASVFQIIRNAVRKLKDSPELGKPLTGDLRGLLSWKVSRYRIIYSVQEDKRTVTIAGAGLRKEGDKRDVYRLLHRLKEKGLLEDLIGYIEKT